MTAGIIFKMMLVSLLALTYVSCNDDNENNTLRFSETPSIENNSIEVYYPSSDPEGAVGAITIQGGDRNYTVYCDNPSVLMVDKKFPNAFVMYPKDWGEAHVIVVDGTGQSIVLTVNVKQAVENHVVKKRDVLILGEETLTAEQKAKIREKALQTIPVTTEGGGYQLIYDNPSDYTKGKLIIYPTEYGKEAGKIESQFTFIPYVPGTEGMKFTYIFQINEEERRFSPIKYYPSTAKMSVAQPQAWTEEVTERIQSSYPSVKVYTQQIWESK